jgi:uncharacterized damage-inducible protein DinB
VIPLSTFHEMYDYNYWARDQQIEACARLSNEQFLRPMGNSFSSLRDTLAHLVGVEWGWQERWRGHSPGKEEYQRDWGPGQYTTLASVKERWGVVEQRGREFLAQLKEPQLELPLNYTNLAGRTLTYPLGQTLCHVVNHQIYHRGQVTTLLRQLDAEAPPVDFLDWQDVRM